MNVGKQVVIESMHCNSIGIALACSYLANLGKKGINIMLFITLLYLTTSMCSL